MLSKLHRHREGVGQTLARHMVPEQTAEHGTELGEGHQVLTIDHDLLAKITGMIGTSHDGEAAGRDRRTGSRRSDGHPALLQPIGTPHLWRGDQRRHCRPDRAGIAQTAANLFRVLKEIVVSDEKVCSIFGSHMMTKYL